MRIAVKFRNKFILVEFFWALLLVGLVASAYGSGEERTFCRFAGRVRDSVYAAAPELSAISTISFPRAELYHSQPREVDNWFHRLESYRELAAELSRFGRQLTTELADDNSLSSSSIALTSEKLRAFRGESGFLLSELSRLKPKYPDAFDPADVKHLQWLAGELILATGFSQAREVFVSSECLGRIWRQNHNHDQNDSLGLEEISRQLLTPSRGELIRQACKKYFRARNGAQAAAVMEIHYRQLIESTDGWRLFSRENDLAELYRHSEPSWRSRFRRTAGETGFGAARVVGTVIGVIPWFPGKLHQHQLASLEISRKMRPLDILLRRQSSNPANLIIPGYWSHAAVWLGTEEQLREADLWDHPAIKDFQEEIMQGKSIYEARYNGLNFTTLEDFLNLDEAAVLRVKDLRLEEIENVALIYRRLSQQRYKPYDYGFDLMTPERVVCTEIIFQSYAHINWPRNRVAGRTVLRPDDIAELAFYRDSPLVFVAYLTGGRGGQAVFRSAAALAATVGYRPPKITRVNEGNNNSSASNKDHEELVRALPAERPRFTLGNGGVWFFQKPTVAAPVPEYRESGSSTGASSERPDSDDYLFVE